MKIQLRGDAGFCREKLMAWCEREGIDFVFGLAQNPRLKKLIEAEMAQAEKQCRDLSSTAEAIRRRVAVSKYLCALHRRGPKNKPPTFHPEKQPDGR